MVYRGTRECCDFFDRAQVFSTTPGHNGWTIKDTSAAGAPTYLCGTGGAVLTLASTSEAEIVTLYQNDVLTYSLADLRRIEWLASVSGVDAVTQIAFGVASAQNDTLDSVAVGAWFRLDGTASTSALVVETDDNTNNSDDNSTGTTLASTLKRCVIDFERGLSDVHFLVDGERVAGSTTFDLSDAASGQRVQPFVQIQKASGTGTPAITLRKFGATYAYAYGA